MFEYQQLPKKDWYLAGTHRVQYYYVFKYPKSLLSRLFIKIQKTAGIKKDISKLPFKIYGGSQWININRITAEYILAEWKRYYSFFRFCYIPDEMIFQTIILNSQLADITINKNYRYYRYEENSSNPA